MKRLLLLSVLALDVLNHANAQKIEYFYDTDPGYGKGTQVDAHIGINYVNIPTENLSEGMHLMSIRYIDSDNRWSSVVSSPLYVVQPRDIYQIEWFIDADPGEGRGNPMSEKTFIFYIPTNDLSIGSHTFTLRARTSSTGNWTVYSETPFEITLKSGVISVTMDMDVKMSCSNGLLHLTSSQPMDAVVEVYGMDGKKYSDEHWDGTKEELTLRIPNSIDMLIVKVTRKDGKRLTRKIIQN